MLLHRASRLLARPESAFSGIDSERYRSSMLFRQKSKVSLSPFSDPPDRSDFSESGGRLVRREESLLHCALEL